MLLLVSDRHVAEGIKKISYLINAQSQQDFDTRHNVCVIITQAQLKSEQNSGSISPPAVWFLSARVRLSLHPLVGRARSPDALRLRAYATFAVIHRTGVRESRRRNRFRKNSSFYPKNI